MDYSDYYTHLHCYLYNVSANVPSGLLQVFLVGLGNLLRLGYHLDSGRRGEAFRYPVLNKTLLILQRPGLALSFQSSIFDLYVKNITVISKVKSSGRPNVGISKSAREYIPFSLALDQGDYFSV